jgi:hypothetical protein
VEKQLFYRTDLHKLYYYNGVNWVDMAGGGVTVHNQLTGRDAADCHPLEAITGLASHASRHQDGGADEINIAGLSGEPAELTTHKNLATGVHGAGSNYLALAPSVSHLVRSFTKGWTSGKLLKGAGVNTDPSEISGWEVVAEVNVAYDCTYVDFINLDSNTDKFYILLATVKNPTATTNTLAIYVNGDYTYTNYYSQYLQALGNTVSSGQFNSPNLGGFASGECLNVMAYINKDPSGYFKYYSFTHRYLGTSTTIQNWAGNRNAGTITNITSLRISGPTNTIGAGSTLMLFRVRTG